MSVSVHSPMLVRIHADAIASPASPIVIPLLVLVGILDPHGLVYALQLDLAIEGINGGPGLFAVRELDECTAVLGVFGGALLLLDNVNARHFAVGGKDVPYEFFIGRFWQLTDEQLGVF